MKLFNECLHGKQKLHSLDIFYEYAISHLRIVNELAKQQIYKVERKKCANFHLKRVEFHKKKYEITESKHLLELFFSYEINMNIYVEMI